MSAGPDAATKSASLQSGADAASGWVRAYDRGVSVRIADDLRWVDVPDGAVVFDPGRGRFLDLSAGGAELWKRLAHGDQLDDLQRWLEHTVLPRKAPWIGTASGIDPGSDAHRAAGGRQYR